MIRLANLAGSLNVEAKWDKSNRMRFRNNRNPSNTSRYGSNIIPKEGRIPADIETAMAMKSTISSPQLVPERIQLCHRGIIAWDTLLSQL